MPTPPVKSAWTISHFTAGPRQPCWIDALQMPRICVMALPRFSGGVKPTSCINRKATTNITARTAAADDERRPERQLREHAARQRADEHRDPADRLPAAEDGLQRAVVADEVSASTSHASTAPEKNVKPRPSPNDASAHAQNGARTDHSHT